MGNPVFCRSNLIDAATLSASTATGGLPVSNLAEDDINKVWRAAATSASSWILADLGSLQTVGAVALVNTNLELNTPVQVRLSTVDATGAAGNAYNAGGGSPTLVAGCDPAYRLFVHVLPAPAIGRYLRIDATITAFEAGRVVAGPTYQPSRNLSLNHPIEELWNDYSRITPSLSGVRWIDREEIQRGLRATFNGLNESEVRGQIAELNRRLGVNRDFLFVRDPDSDNLSRDSLWGYVSEPIQYPMINLSGFFEVNLAVWNRI